MNKLVKKFADEGNIQRLRYIFYDSFEVDPTFEKYKEDYEYCKNIPGFFEDYKELTSLDNKRLDAEYWTYLKRDLKTNFAEKRFEFMKNMAPSIFAEKVAKLKEERMTADQTTTDSGSRQNNGEIIVEEPQIVRPSQAKVDVDAIQRALDAKAAEKIAAEREKEAERQRQREKEEQEQIKRQAEEESRKKVQGIVPQSITWILIRLFGHRRG